MNIDIIKSVYDLKQQKEKLEKQIEDLNLQVKVLDTAINNQSSVILNDMKNEKRTEFKIDDLIVSFMQKRTATFNDLDVINYLKTNNLNQFINVKETVAKTPLNKELKNNIQLKEALSPYMGETTTDYVVITDSIHFEKMKEHINENKNK
jgi:hypothetical protein